MNKFTSIIVIFIIAQILTANVCLANDPITENDNETPAEIIIEDDVIANQVSENIGENNDENIDPVNRESTGIITLDEDVVAHQVDGLITHQAFQFVVFLPVVQN